MARTAHARPEQIHSTKQVTLSAKVLHHPCFGQPAVVNPRRRTRKAEAIPHLGKYRARRDYETYKQEQQAAGEVSTPKEVDWEEDLKYRMKCVQSVLKGMAEQLEILEIERRLSQGQLTGKEATPC